MIKQRLKEKEKLIQTHLQNIPKLVNIRLIAEKFSANFVLVVPICLLNLVNA